MREPGSSAVMMLVSATLLSSGIATILGGNPTLGGWQMFVGLIGVGAIFGLRR